MIRKCRKWTEEDTAHAFVLLGEGKALNEVGRIMGRSGHTVRANMQKCPEYVSRPVGRPKGGIQRKTAVDQPEGWCKDTSNKFLSMSMRVEL
jgi:hypothetical protein